MAKIHNKLVVVEGSIQPVIRPMEAKDQPCTLTDCTSNEGHCIKRFFASNKPEGYGTVKCPGFIKRGPTGTNRPSSLGMRAVKKRKPTKHLDGVQATLGTGEGNAKRA